MREILPSRNANTQALRMSTWAPLPLPRARWRLKTTIWSPASRISSISKAVVLEEVEQVAKVDLDGVGSAVGRGVGKHAVVWSSRAASGDQCSATSTFGLRRTRFFACALLQGALELLGRRRSVASGVADDAYDLPPASARTGPGGRPVRRHGSLRVSTAALTNHVGNRWQRCASPSPETVIAEVGGVPCGLARKTHVICTFPLGKSC